LNSAYLLLFLSALGSATLLPLQSEALLSALIVAGEKNLIALLVVASVGNVLGSLINWWLGLHLEKYRDSRFFPLKPAQLARAQVRYQKAGYWSLLLSWRSEEHTSELQSLRHLVCRLLLEKKNSNSGQAQRRTPDTSTLTCT